MNKLQQDTYDYIKELLDDCLEGFVGQYNDGKLRETLIKEFERLFSNGHDEYIKFKIDEETSKGDIINLEPANFYTAIVILCCKFGVPFPLYEDVKDSYIINDCVYSWKNETLCCVTPLPCENIVIDFKIKDI